TFARASLNFPVTIIRQRRNCCLFANLRAHIARALEQNIVKQTAFNRNLTTLAKWKVDSYLMTVDCDKLHGLELRVRQSPHLLRDGEVLQHRPTRPILTIASDF